LIQIVGKCPTGAILQDFIVLDGFNPTRIDYEKCYQGFVNYGFILDLPVQGMVYDINIEVIQCIK